MKGGGTVDGTLTTADVKNRSLLKGDFKAGQLPAGPHGARGPAGADGTARGYARVSMQGNLVPSQSKGVLRVRHAVRSGDCRRAPAHRPAGLAGHGALEAPKTAAILGDRPQGVRVTGTAIDPIRIAQYSIARRR